MRTEQAEDIKLAAQWVLGREWAMLPIHERFPDSDDDEGDIKHPRRGAEPSAASTADQAESIDVE